MNNTDKAYQDLLKRILGEGREKGDRTGTGTISIFSHTLELDMADGFPLLTTKKMFTKGIIHELLWFLNGDTNIKYLVENGVNIWTPDAYRGFKEKCELAQKDSAEPVTDITTIDKFKTAIKDDVLFSNIYGELGPIYGKQWVNWESYVMTHNHTIRVPDRNGQRSVGLYEVETQHVNQIQNAIDDLNTNPDSRRIMVSAWNVAEIGNMTLPPCHWAFELYTEELSMGEKEEWCKHNSNHMDCPMRRLSLKWHQRSVDTFLGLPFNIASYGLLLEMFAQQTNMMAGKLIGDLTNVHIYKNHIEQCKEQLHNQPLELPNLILRKSDDMFSYNYDDFKIDNYKHHPPIKGDISV